MNINIVYFSQTGNTRKVANTFRKTFLEAGHSVSNISLKKAAHSDFEKADVIGFGTPCFSGHAPTPVRNFLKMLPDLGGKKAFVFATSGGAPGRVLYDLNRLVSAKGARVIGGFLTRGELYHPVPCLIGRMSGRPNAQDLEKARRFALAILEHLRVDRPDPMPESRPDTFEPGKGFYDMVSVISTDGFLRLMMPEPKLQQDRCNLCNWCVEQCPTDNITVNDYPVLGDHCIRCYRCLTGCPEKAYSVNWLIGNLATLSFYNTYFERWFGDLEPGEKIYG